MAKSKKRRGKAKAAKRTKKRKPLRVKPAKRKTKKAKRPVAKKRKRTTAEGMRRAMKLKHAAEEREHEQHPTPLHNWPAQIPQQEKPDPVPNNPQEQGNLANILQNTTSRRAG